MAGRRDPMVAAGAVIAGIRGLASARAGACATVGRVQATPGGTNVIASHVDVWIDARAEDDLTARSLIDEIEQLAAAAAAAQGCQVTATEESWLGTVRFPDGPRHAVDAALGGVPSLPTGGGHDAGVLASAVPTAMLFVRNPTGVSHAPDEYATAADCAAGIDSLESVLRAQLGARGEQA